MSKQLEFMGFPIKVESRWGYFVKRIQFWRYKKVMNGVLMERKS